MSQKLEIKRRNQYRGKGQMVIRVDSQSYNNILDVANESGESICSIASKMIDFAFENIVYKD